MGRGSDAYAELSSHLVTARLYIIGEYAFAGHRFSIFFVGVLICTLTPLIPNITLRTVEEYKKSEPISYGE